MSPDASPSPPPLSTTSAAASGLASPSHFEATPLQRLALLMLLFEGAPVKQSDLRPRLRPAQRRPLIDAGLVEAVPEAEVVARGLIDPPARKGRARYLIPTAAAWAWTTAHLDEAVPLTTNGARALNLLLPRLGTYLAHTGRSLAELVGAAPTPPPAPAPIAKGQSKDHAEPYAEPHAEPHGEPDLEGVGESALADSSNEAILEVDTPPLWEAVRATYRRLSAPGARLRLAALRAALPETPRAELDATLRAMQLEDALVLYALDDPAEITASDHAAALAVGGEACHVLYIRD